MIESLKILPKDIVNIILEYHKALCNLYWIEDRDFIVYNFFQNKKKKKRLKKIIYKI